jgi:putative protein-disulfide isomerase
MCSWCWGFHPIIQELREKYADLFSFSLVVGGLRTKGQMPWTEESKAYLLQNWKAVAQQTNQPFDVSLLKKAYFDYDTYPACKALISVRELWGEEESFIYLEKIQRRFYQNGEDITLLEHLILDVKDREMFLTFYKSKRAEILMQHDFSKARSMGANSFPSLVKIDKDGHMICQRGYQSLEKIINL